MTWDYKITLTDYKITLTDYKITLTDYKITLTDYKITLTDYKITLTDYKITLTDYNITITDYNITLTGWCVIDYSVNMNTGLGVITFWEKGAIFTEQSDFSVPSLSPSPPPPSLPPD